MVDKIQERISFSGELLERLISVCREALPQKSYGIIAGREKNLAEELYPLKTNLRPDNSAIGRIFTSYGEFYCDKDRGFWIDKREQYQTFKAIEEKGQKIVAIYHSHRCRLAVPSQVDVDLHYDPDVSLVIVSLANPEHPEVKAFRISNNRYMEAQIFIVRK